VEQEMPEIFDDVVRLYSIVLDYGLDVGDAYRAKKGLYLKEWLNNGMDERPGTKMLFPIGVPIATVPLKNDWPGIGLFREGVAKFASEQLLRTVYDVFSMFPVLLSVDEIQSFRGFAGGDKAAAAAKLLSGNRVLSLVLPQMSGKIRHAVSGFSALGADVARWSPAKIQKFFPPAGKGASLSILALEQCNRGCGHCSAHASTGLPGLKFADFLKWSSILGMHSEVKITFGEPFFWRDNHKGRLMTVGDIAETILQDPGVENLRIVTSGINTRSAVERTAMKKIASLPEDFRRRITLVLTLSEFPHYSLPGLNRADSVRQVQRETMRFALDNSLNFTFISFLRLEQLHELFFPVLSGFAGGVPSESIALVHSNYDFRKAMEGPGNMRSCRLAPYGFAQLLTLAGDGAVLPGCCMFPSVYAQIADMNTIKCREELQAKAQEFSHRIKRLHERRELDCLKCIRVAGTLRHPARAAKFLGAQFEAVKGMRR
jgi:hypothetical protein